VQTSTKPTSTVQTSTKPTSTVLTSTKPQTSSAPTTLQTSTRPGPTSVYTPVPGDGTPTATGPKGPKVTISGNPFAGYEIYANPYYASEIQTAVKAFQTAGDSANAAKAASVASIGTFLWLDVVRKVPALYRYLDDIRYLQSQGRKVIAPIVVYDLPDRDCAAKASAGEFALADGGWEKYLDYINQIAAVVKEYDDINTVFVLEPDGLANMITNMNVAKCQGAAKYYRDGLAYAMKTLNFPHVSMYVDAGHAGWLGWPANIGPAAKTYAEVYKAAGSPRAARGLATNVSNFNAYSAAAPDTKITQSNPNYDEKHFIEALGPMLVAEGWDAKFIVDTGRSGQQGLRQEWGNWCNVYGAGFGPRPTTNTGDTSGLLDAFVWVKPGGESDGTSDSSAVRYDAMCGKSDAHKPAPEAGHWFNEYFMNLVKNANPAL